MLTPLIPLIRCRGARHACCRAGHDPPFLVAEMTAAGLDPPYGPVRTDSKKGLCASISISEGEVVRGMPPMLATSVSRTMLCRAHR
jgi:hypothetical protein